MIQKLPKNAGVIVISEEIPTGAVMDDTGKVVKGSWQWVNVNGANAYCFVASNKV